MSEEKETIGSDVLGGYGSGMVRMPEKKRKELEKKLKEELAKKKAEEERKKREELPKENIPGEIPGELSPEEIAELEQRGILTGKLLEDEGKEKLKKKGLVHVREHVRSFPKSEEDEEE